MRLRGLTVMLVTAGCASASLRPTAAADRDALLAEDARFDAQVAERGLEAWIAEFVPSTAIWDGDHLAHDRELYRTKMGSMLGAAGSHLRWQPAWAKSNGNLGYTTGRWQLHRVRDGADQVVATGKYVTVWARQASGAWRVVFDMGNSDPEPSAPEIPPRSTS